MIGKLLADAQITLLTPGAWRVIGRWFLLAAFALAAAVSTVHVVTPTLSLDGSWALAVQRISAEFGTFQNGHIFTYGQLMPLQFPMPGIELYAYAFFFVVAAYSGYRIMSACGALPVATLLLCCAIGENVDGLLLITFCACLAIALARRIDLVLMLMVTLICHVKYSMIMVAIGAFVVIDFWNLVIRKQGHPLNTLVFLLMFFTLYLAFGGGFLDIGPFCANLASIVFSYNEAMAVHYVPADSIFYYSALSWLAIAVAVTVFRRRAGLDAFKSDQALVLILAALVMFVGIKAGYTRADGHIVFAWSTVFVLLMMLTSMGSWLAPKADGGGRNVMIAGLVTLVAAQFIVPKPSYFSNNESVIAVQTDVFKRLNDSALNPAVRQRVRHFREKLTLEARKRLANAGLLDVSIDGYPTQIGDLALAAPNYTHRPVVQTYSSYDNRLQAADAAFLRTKGPDVILMYPITDIDIRLPGLLLGPSYFSILSNYQQTCTEYALPKGEDVAHVWQRRKEPVDLSLAYDSPRRTRVGEWIDIPPGIRTNGLQPAAKIEAHARLSGRVIGLLFKPSALMIDLEYVDGTTRTHRFISKAALEGFPFLPAGTERLWSSEDGTELQVARFRLREEADYLPYYSDAFSYALGSYTLPSADKPRKPHGCLMSSLRSELAPPFLDLTDSSTLFAHAPGSAVIELAENEKIRLTANISDGAYPCSDGVQFTASKQSDDGTKEGPLADHSLEKAKKPVCGEYDN